MGLKIEVEIQKCSRFKNKKYIKSNPDKNISQEYN